MNLHRDCWINTDLRFSFLLYENAQIAENFSYIKQRCSEGGEEKWVFDLFLVFYCSFWIWLKLPYPFCILLVVLPVVECTLQRSDIQNLSRITSYRYLINEKKPYVLCSYGMIQFRGCTDYIPVIWSKRHLERLRNDVYCQFIWLC